MDPLDRLYRQNTKYRPLHDGTFWLLSDAGGWGLALDDPVYSIWSTFDGRPTDQAIAAATEETGVSAAFAESTVRVLARAGMLIPSQPLDPVAYEPPATVSELSAYPLVSIIITAGREARVHLETCLPSVIAQTYPSLEVILVDNQTTDDSAAFTKQSFPQVRVISTAKPLGFGAANNLGMRQARGDVFFLLNDDTEMAPNCVAECVRKMLRSDGIAAVVPKMRLFYMRSFLNSMGNSTDSDGHSCDNFIGYLDVGQFDNADQVFTACFGAAMLRRSAVERVGYIDESYLYYYEDTDWSFRARMRGYDIVAAPQAIVYHKFNATTDTLPSTFKLGLIVHNRLRFVWKNLDFERARKFSRIYREDDRRSIAQAKTRGMHDVARAYRRSRRRWIRSLPKLAIARWQTRRSRHPSFADDAAFALTEGMPRHAMYGRYPVIFTPIIREHYMRLEIFEPDSPVAPEDLAPTAAHTIADMPSLGQKVRRALQEEGISGLMRETWQYLRWRFILSQ